MNTHDPDDERSTAGMWDFVLQNAPSSAFGSPMAILAPYVGGPMNEVTSMVASWGEAETQRQQRGVQTVIQRGPPKGKMQGCGPPKLTRT